MTSRVNHSRKVLFFAIWLVGLLIPLGAVILWDSMPRFQAARQLREAGIELTPASVHHAIDQRDLATLTLLHKARVRLDEPDADGDTPLIASIKAGDRAITEFLAARAGVDCDQPGADGIPPVAHAITLGRLDAVKHLLLRIDHPNAGVRDGEGNEEHPLFPAIRDKNRGLLRLLLTHPRLNVDARDTEGKTPLHHAVCQNDLLVVRALLSGRQHLNPNLASHDGETPLHFAVQAARPRMVKYLLDHGARPASGEMAARFMLTAIHQSDAETLRLLLAHGANANSEHPDGSVSLLNYALNHSEIGCVIEFLEAGAEPGGALRQAIECGQGVGAQIIAAHFDHQDRPWAYQEGLLELAISSGNPRCIDLLLDNGTDPDQFSSIGQRVLIMSLAARKNRVVKRLLELGADPNHRIEHPPSSEFLAYFEGDAKTLYYLKRDQELTPLMLAALTEQQEAVRHLIAHGAARNSYSSIYRRYAVAFAAERHNVPIMQMLLGREPSDESRKVLISLKNQKAVMYQDGKAVNSSRVSTGRRGYRTPTGTYVITNKYRHHNSSIYGSSMPYFMRLSCGDFGLHYSASVPSYPASHGCVRMPWTQARQFYGTLEVGDIVVIE